MKAIFVEHDESGVITSFSSSSVSEESIEVEVTDEVYSEIMFQGGRYLLSNGEVVKDNVDLLVTLKQEKDVEMNRICSQKILDGFTHEINGKEYHFSFDIEAQLNFQGAERVLQSGMINELEWTVRHEGEVQRITITPEIMGQLALKIIVHKSQNIAHYRDVLSPLIQQCKTVEELQAITWDSGKEVK